VVAANDFRQRIAERVQKVAVRREDGAVGSKLDRRLRTRNGVKLCSTLNRVQLRFSDIVGDLNDTLDLAAAIFDRIVIPANIDLVA